MLIHDLYKEALFSVENSGSIVFVFDKYPASLSEKLEERSLFFTPAHLATQSNHKIFSFFLLKGCIPGLTAEFHCTPEKCDSWVSPPRAPFGGIHVHEECTDAELNFFLNSIKKWIKLNSGRNLIIKTAPACYDPKIQKLLHLAYMNTQFCEIRTLSNHYIPISATDFYQQIHLSEKRRLRKSVKAGFQAGLETDMSDREAYHFLKNCRVGNGYPMPVSEYEFHMLMHKFPANFLVFTVTSGGSVIAMIITVKVSKSIIYTFLSSYLPDYASFSPIVLLIQAIYEFGQQNGFTILDFGTSQDHLGAPKESLSRFKSNLGGLTCPKITYHLTF